MAKLENKTKAQLIEIIQRKDGVEKELRDKVESLTNECAGLQVNVEAYSTDNAALKDHLSMMEDEIKKLKSKADTLDKALSITKENLKKEYAKVDTLNKATVDANCEIVSLKETLQEVKQQRNSFVVTTLVAVVLIILGAIL